MLIQKLLKFDCFVSLLFGLVLFLFPNWILSLVIREPCDGVHFHMARVAGSVLVGQSLTWWKWSKSTVQYLGTSALTSRLHSATFCFAAVVHSRTYFHEYFFMTSMRVFTTLCVLYIAICILFMIYYQWTIGEYLYESKKQKVFNFLIQMDAIAALIIGGFWCAYPDLILQHQVKFQLSPSHYFICRCFGAYLLSTSTLSSRSLYFEKTEDRTSWGLGRALICILIFSSQVYSQYAYLQWWTGKHWVGTGIFLSWSSTCWFASVQQFRGKFR